MVNEMAFVVILFAEVESIITELNIHAPYIVFPVREFTVMLLAALNGIPFDVSHRIRPFDVKSFATRITFPVKPVNSIVFDAATFAEEKKKLAVYGLTKLLTGPIDMFVDCPTSIVVFDIKTDPHVGGFVPALEIGLQVYDVELAPADWIAITEKSSTIDMNIDRRELSETILPTSAFNRFAIVYKVLFGWLNIVR